MPYSCAISKAAASYHELHGTKTKKKKQTKLFPNGRTYEYGSEEDNKHRAFMMARKGGFRGTFEEYIR
jgi:hypothetical protein